MKSAENVLLDLVRVLVTPFNVALTIFIPFASVTSALIVTVVEVDTGFGFALMFEITGSVTSYLTLTPAEGISLLPS